MSRRKNFILIGALVNKSLSPKIHQSFASQFNMNISYCAITVDMTNLMPTINNFFANGGCGLNVTAPYKEIVFQQLQNHTNSALRAKAINTIFRKNNILCGANTDGTGLLADFKANNILIAAKRLAIFGAGGAVRGILQALISQDPSHILLINRNYAKAAKVAADFKDFLDIDVCDLSNITGKRADIIINAISAENNCYTGFNFANSICYDLNYQKNSQFMLTAQLQGASKVVNGLGMLIQQAAQAFYLWHGKKPQIKPVLELLM